MKKTSPPFVRFEPWTSKLEIHGALTWSINPHLQPERIVHPEKVKKKRDMRLWRFPCTSSGTWFGFCILQRVYGFGVCVGGESHGFEYLAGYTSLGSVYVIACTVLGSVYLAGYTVLAVSQCWDTRRCINSPKSVTPKKSIKKGICYFVWVVDHTRLVDSVSLADDTSFGFMGLAGRMKIIGNFLGF